MSASGSRRVEWAELYERLRGVLGRRGSEDPSGRTGDFWLVDDDWGTSQHKVVVFNLIFVTPQLASEIQQVLGSCTHPWEVWFQLELRDREGGDPLGIIIMADRIEELWDRAALQRDLPNAFRWGTEATDAQAPRALIDPQADLVLDG
jgi:hypothetical protein